MTLPKGELTPDNQISPEFAFTGEVSILIQGGSGTVELQRKLSETEFYTLTDTAGNPAVFSCSDSVALNAEISNKCTSAKYRLKATVDAPINYVICK